MDAWDEHFEIEIIRSARRTVALELRADGGVLVRAPRRMPERDIRAFVASKRRWIESHRQRLFLRRQQMGRTRPLTPEQLADLSAAAAADMAARCERFAPLIGVTYGRIAIRRQRTRWGSCSGKGDLNFNCLLMLAPEPVRDYVVVHELCHRKYMDHSPRFWAEVERVLPDWRERRRWLRDYGGGLLERAERMK